MAKRKAKRSKRRKTQDPWVIAGIAAAVVIIALVIYGSLSGWSFMDTEPGPGTAEDEGTLLVSVNGRPVYQEEVDELYDQLPAQYQAVITREQLINQTVARELLLSEADRLGITVPEAEVQQAIDMLMMQSQLTAEQLEQQLQQYGLTLDDMREQYRQQLIIAELLNQSVYSTITVTDQEVREFYNENPELFEQARASHILVDTEEEAYKVLDMLREGADFATTAEAYSLDEASAADGGDLGYFTQNMMVEPFGEAVFSLEVGELSDVVQTQFGYHIIKLTARKSVQLEEARPTIVRAIRQEQEPEQAAAYIDSLWEQADIVYY